MIHTQHLTMRRDPGEYLTTTRETLVVDSNMMDFQRGIEIVDSRGSRTAAAAMPAEGDNHHARAPFKNRYSSRIRNKNR